MRATYIWFMLPIFKQKITFVTYAATTEYHIMKYDFQVSIILIEWGVKSCRSDNS